MTKTEMIYQQIRMDIVAAVYKDEVINEQTIAEKYHVSKTPAREALNLLCNEGYLVKYARQGYYVKQITIDEYYQIIDYRFILESAAVKAIIAKCSDEQIKALYNSTTEKTVPYIEYNSVNIHFHMSMAHLAGNRYVSEALQHAFYLNARNTGIRYYESVKDDIHVDHRRIIDAILARDLERALALLEKDVRQTDLVQRGVMQ